jgi:hypothetical protein
MQNFLYSEDAKQRVKYEYLSPMVNNGKLAAIEWWDKIQMTSASEMVTDVCWNNFEYIRNILMFIRIHTYIVWRVSRMRELLKRETSKQKKNECLEPFLDGARVATTRLATQRWRQW